MVSSRSALAICVVAVCAWGGGCVLPLVKDFSAFNQFTFSKNLACFNATDTGSVVSAEISRIDDGQYMLSMTVFAPGESSENSNGGTAVSLEPRMLSQEEVSTVLDVFSDVGAKVGAAPPAGYCAAFPYCVTAVSWDSYATSTASGICLQEGPYELITTEGFRRIEDLVELLGDAP